MNNQFRKLIASRQMQQSMSRADNPYEREASMRQIKIIIRELQCVYVVLLQPLQNRAVAGWRF